MYVLRFIRCTALHTAGCTCICKLGSFYRTPCWVVPVGAMDSPFALAASSAAASSTARLSRRLRS